MGKHERTRQSRSYQHRIKQVVQLTLALVIGLGSSACRGSSLSSAESSNQTAPGSVNVRVASLKGPTSIGLASFMDLADQREGDTTGLLGNYDFTVYGTADEIVPRLVAGDIDIALLPANMAAVLYNRTGGGVSVINVNTLGVLYIVSADNSITSLSSLAGRTVVLMGRGTTPDIVFNHLLKQAGIRNVTLEYRSEATEVAAIINADPTAIALLPEPYVSSVCNKNPKVAPRISLVDEWQGRGSGGRLVTGVTVVRTDFLTEHPDVIAEFLANHQNSVTRANTSPGEVASLVVKFGIIDNANIALQAIPRCNLVCLTGGAMRNALENYLYVLFTVDPDTIGGHLPGNDFYFIETNE